MLGWSPALLPVLWLAVCALWPAPWLQKQNTPLAGPCRWQQARLQTAFWQWRAALEERKAAADNLRRCLTRKRIAFKLFRNWYWESFDDEMQARRGGAGEGWGCELKGRGWVGKSVWERGAHSQLGRGSVR